MDNHKEMKKILILNGSPRRQGDTAAMLKMLETEMQQLSQRGDRKENLEIRTIHCYDSKISPCIDCRYCRTHEGCVFKDEMQEIYRYIIEADAVVIASPIYFGTLTGKLLDIASRLQCFFSARFFQKKNLILKEKRGAIILAGGGSGGSENAVRTAEIILKELRCSTIFEPVISGCTDRIPAAEDTSCKMQINDLAAWLVQTESDI